VATAANTETEQELDANAEAVLAASRRIYIFDFFSDIVVGRSVKMARYVAFSFVGSGFKTLIFMTILIFWSVICFIFWSIYGATICVFKPSLCSA